MALAQAGTSRSIARTASPFPPLKERFDRLQDQLAIVTGLWTTAAGERFSFEGMHYQVTDASELPKPVQRPHLAIVIGGKGTRRTPRLAALYADDFNAGLRVQPTVLRGCAPLVMR